MKSFSFGVMLDDDNRPAQLWRIEHCATGSYYVRPADQPGAALTSVCVDDFWILFEGND